MFSDRIFLFAFTVSLVAHGVILLQSPNIHLFRKEAQQQQTQLVYVKNKPEKKEEPRLARAEKEPFLKIPSKITAKKITPPPFVDTQRALSESPQQKASLRVTIDKPAFFKPDVIAVKKKITLPPVDLGKMDNPSYISYYQLVREKIRRVAYQSYTRTEVGEVYLSFIISSDGSLRGIRLAEDKSSRSTYLKAVALRSVKDASPFPDFPKDLDYPELSFNVVISFEVE